MTSVGGELRTELERLIGTSRSIGEELVDAAGRLIQLQCLPSSGLLERLGTLRDSWSALIANALEAAGTEDGEYSGTAPSEVPLLGQIAIVETAIERLERHAVQEIARSQILGLLGKITRLELRDGSADEGLARLRAEASLLATRITASEDPDLMAEYDSIASGSHRYCHLLALVEGAESSGFDKYDHIIGCTASFGPEITQAALRGRIAIAEIGNQGDLGHREPDAVERMSGGDHIIEAPGNPEQAGSSAPTLSVSEAETPATETPLPMTTRGTGPTGSSACFRPAHRAGPVAPLRKRPTWTSARPDSKGASVESVLRRRNHLESRLPITIVPPVLDEKDDQDLVETAPGTENSSDGMVPTSLTSDPVETLPISAPPVVREGRLDGLAGSPPRGDSEDRGSSPILEGRDSIGDTTVNSSLLPSEQPIVNLDGTTPDRAAEQTAESFLATPEEILDRCSGGDYLGAGLLALGRVFAGLPEGDPGVEILLAARHVLDGSSTAPWPDWCYDSGGAADVCNSAPESARLALLAILCLVSRSGAWSDPFPPPVKDALIEAFNGLPDVRGWLAEVLESIGVPGLWEQIRRREAQDALAVYREAYAGFLRRYEGGLSHRSPNAAYIHKQDHYVSRLPATRMLHDSLGPSGPGLMADEAVRGIRELVQMRPEAVTAAWLRSTQKATGRGVRLRGNQQAELVQRAADYIDCARRVWQASEALRQSGPQPGDVARRRERILAAIPGLRERARGTAWCALLERLMEGLAP